MRRSMMYVMLLAVALVGGLFAVAAGLGQRENIQVATTSDAPRPKLQGVAVRRNEQLVLRAEDGEEILLQLGPGASEFRVTRNNENASLDQIQEGDFLNVALNHDGTAYRVDALSEQNVSAGTLFRVPTWQRALPIIITLVALALATLIVIGGIRIRRRTASR